MLHVVIMAGGGGTRLWPLSTSNRPKQFLRLSNDGKSMIGLTLDRIGDLADRDHRWVVTVEEQVELLKQDGVDFPDENIVLEPVGRNTAPCIGLAAKRVLARDPDAIMLVLPADHLIRDERTFRASIRSGLEAVRERDAIVTIGIEPTRPETGYGYIHATSEEVMPGVYGVSEFTEKPDLKRAVEFLATGEYLWNSGMFLWSAKRILAEMETHLPDLRTTLEKIGELPEGARAELDTLYRSVDPISIDYGIIERTDNVLMVRGTFDWSDIGGFAELHRLSDKDEAGNSLAGRVFTQDTRNAYVRSTDPRPVAVIGLENVTVIATDDGILVCDTRHAQKVKGVVDWLKAGK